MSDLGGCRLAPRRLDTIDELIIQAADSPLPSLSWLLAAECDVFLRRTGRLAAKVTVRRTAALAAQEAGDDLAWVASSRNCADALSRIGDHDAALRVLRALLPICVELNDKRELLGTHLSFVRTEESRGDRNSAVAHARAAVALARRLGDQRMSADAATVTA